MKAFVTGGTGFIGANLVRQLLGQGHEVVCLTRRTSPGLCLEGLDVTLIQADLSDPQAQTSGNKNIREFPIKNSDVFTSLPPSLWDQNVTPI